MSLSKVLDLVRKFRKTDQKTPIVLISGQANVEMAVKATKLGALDFLEKPLSTDKLLVTVENALRLSRLEDENRERIKAARLATIVAKLLEMRITLTEKRQELLAEVRRLIDFEIENVRG